MLGHIVRVDVCLNALIPVNAPLSLLEAYVRRRACVIDVGRVAPRRSVVVDAKLLNNVWVDFALRLHLVKSLTYFLFLEPCLLLQIPSLVKQLIFLVFKSLGLLIVYLNFSLDLFQFVLVASHYPLDRLLPLQPLKVVLLFD